MRHDRITKKGKTWMLMCNSTWQQGHPSGVTSLQIEKNAQMK